MASSVPTACAEPAQMQSHNKVLVVGEKSFIGRALVNYDRVSFKNFNQVNLNDYSVVVNCALNPAFKIGPYRESIDVDYLVGRRACEKGCHFIMISTSRVYGDSSELTVYNESSPTDPTDYYGKNKLEAEHKLLTRFPDQVTVLRGSNIFGFEYGRNSFMGYCMSQLVNEGRITFTISDQIRRDFLFVDDAVKIIEAVCRQRPIGIYNLSSNYALPIHRVIENLIAGYDYGGEIVYANDRLDRQFVLDNSKLKSVLGIEIGPYDFDAICRKLGQQLLAHN